MTVAGIHFKRLPNLYKDSVSLMQLAARLRGLEGIEQASCLMATPANLAQLLDADLAIDVQAAPTDLLVVVRGETAACEAALEEAQALLLGRGDSNQSGAEAGPGFKPPLSSLELALEQAPAANLALISVPGDYAAAEALKALTLGLHVLLFSDNVSVAEERQLKRFVRERGLLVMGPDCGTAIVNGVPLGFANVVRRGEIGLVAASGTGLQEVTCGIHNLGSGISQALGTGGRDLKDEIGGITMLQGLAALAADAATKVIVLISKPPSPAIAQQVQAAAAAAAAAGKPVVVHFIGAAPGAALPRGLVAANSLRHAAEVAVALARGEAVPAPLREPDAPARAAVAALAKTMAPSQREVRALFTGGTFCYEAQSVFIERGLACRSNAPAHGALSVGDKGRGPSAHLFLDLGDDDYTRGRPHPMIDPLPRDALLREQAADPATAAFLFDVVLGHGSHAEPAAGLALAITEAQRGARDSGRTLAFIGHVCGTEGDPQDKVRQTRLLQDAGAIIAGSNVEAALLAATLAQARAA